MMRRVLALTILIVGSVLPLTAQTMAYDSEKVVEIMRENLAAIRPLGGLIESGDYEAAGSSFLRLADGSMSLLSMSPPKGNPADWTRVNIALVRAALAGVEACVVQDRGGADQALGEIRALNKEGHSAFR
jgi:hypothetical protein